MTAILTLGDRLVGRQGGKRTKRKWGSRRYLCLVDCLPVCLSTWLAVCLTDTNTPLRISFSTIYTKIQNVIYSENSLTLYYKKQGSQCIPVLLMLLGMCGLAHNMLPSRRHSDFHVIISIIVDAVLVVKSSHTIWTKVTIKISSGDTFFLLLNFVLVIF